MPHYSFALVVQNVDLLAPDALDALVDAGCRDATFGKEGGRQYADFDREAKSFPAAVLSAIRDVRQALPEAAIVRVEPDDLVSMTEIAQRLGLTKEAIRLYVEGRRGGGGFPAPLAWIAQKHRVWRWSDVADWLVTARDADAQLVANAQFIAALNGVLQANLHSRHLEATERRAVAEALEEDLLHAI
jgi:hypothetical protein